MSEKEIICKSCDSNYTGIMEENKKIIIRLEYDGEVIEHKVNDWEVL